MSEPLDLDALRATCEKIAKALPSTSTPRTILALLVRLEAAERECAVLYDALSRIAGLPYAIPTRIAERALNALASESPVDGDRREVT